MKRIFLIILLVYVYQNSLAQINLDYFETRGEVRRISSNYAEFVKRPQLSLNGFSKLDISHGNDIEHIINNLENHTDLLNAIKRNSDIKFFNLSEMDIRFSQNQSSYKDDINSNVRNLQYRMFIHMIQYIYTYHNPGDFNVDGLDFSMQFDEDIFLRFLVDLKKSRDHFLVSEHPNGGNDYVQWTAGLTNYARAIDLYLAFEIFVQEYNAPSYYFLNEA